MTSGQNSKAFTSPDGITWTNKSTGLGLSGAVAGHKAGYWMVANVVSLNKVTANDGATWVAGTTKNGKKFVTDDYWTNFKNSGDPDDGRVWTSVDATVWTEQTNHNTVGHGVFGLIKNGSNYVAYGHNGAMITANQTEWFEGDVIPSVASPQAITAVILL
jgi:hypothetical protein